MRVYVPLVLWDIPEDDKEICDFILQVYSTKEDALIMNPDAQILELEIEPNPQDN